MDESKSDFLLSVITQVYLDIRNGTDARLQEGITLQMGGFLVSGIIITGKDYFLSHPLTDQIKEIADKLMKEEESSEAPPPLEYIHLRDAKFFVPGHAPFPTTKEGVYWRGRIDRVDGFVLGLMAEILAE